MKDSLTGIILAGGRSRRYGTDKSQAPWGDVTLLEAVRDSLRPLVRETLVIGKEESRMRAVIGPDVRFVSDDHEAYHAFGGIATGLRNAKTPWSFACACDMPFITRPLIDALWEVRWGNEAVIPVWKGIAQPLCALYSREFLGRLEDRAANGLFRLSDLLTLPEVRVFSEDEVRAVDPEGLVFTDIDTPRDMTRALELSHA